MLWSTKEIVLHVPIFYLTFLSSSLKPSSGEDESNVSNFVDFFNMPLLGALLCIVMFYDLSLLISALFEKMPVSEIS